MYSSSSYQSLLGKEIDCICGKRHTVPLKYVVLEDGAIRKLPGILENITNSKYGLIICDDNTYPIAGKDVENLLTARGYELITSMLKGSPSVRPDEKTITQALINFEPSMGFILAIGSGTINDIARFISSKTGKPYIIIATAPSMDGYASTVSPLIINDFKKTFSTTCPTAIIADLDILCNAPSPMLLAGFGDILGKLISLADWQLGSTIMNESSCLTAFGLVKEAVQKVFIHSRGIHNREVKSITALMEALILSGIAMMLAGSSRPASGCEHHISHYLEMMCFIKGKEPILHGTKVGLATSYAALLYNQLSCYDSSRINIQRLVSRRPDYEAWKENIKKAYGPIAQEIILENDILGWEAGSYQNRLRKIKTLWDFKLIPIFKSVPSISLIKKWTHEAGADFSPESLKIEPELIRQALLHAKDIRSRYTALRLASDIGLLNPETVQKIMTLH